MDDFPATHADLLDARFATLADRVGAKYGADLRVNDSPGERRVAVTIDPTRIFAFELSI